MNKKTLQIEVQCEITPSFRVAQVAGMFDVTLEEKSRTTFTVQKPPQEGDWNIGLIVGPSGSGKSTIAATLFPDVIYGNCTWPADRAVVDGFGEIPMKDITRLFTTVGFSSPPSWIKPYHVLSNGEKFRCDLARALSVYASKPCKEKPPLVVFDEFTSVVDRNVAKVASAAIAKGIRGGAIPVKFIAVTCHYDIAQWLEPDWVLDMADGTVSGRSLRRPEIALGIFRCTNRAWPLFAKHHYLKATISPSAQCYIALWEGVPVAFCAVLPLMGFKGRRRISRIVTLPDYQGLGIGSALLDSVAQMYREQGMRMNITASHPSIIRHCGKSQRWKAVNFMKTGAAKSRNDSKMHSGSQGRCVASFEYVP